MTTCIDLEGLTCDYSVMPSGEVAPPTDTLAMKSEFRTWVIEAQVTRGKIEE